jgi:hypothetical protein
MSTSFKECLLSYGGRNHLKNVCLIVQRSFEERWRVERGSSGSFEWSSEGESSDD